MLNELMQSKGLDAHGVIIQITEKLIDQYGRKTLDKYNYNGDKLIERLQHNNPDYDKLCKEYINL